jgi:hypothetical protein
VRPATPRRGRPPDGGVPEASGRGADHGGSEGLRDTLLGQDARQLQAPGLPEARGRGGGRSRGEVLPGHCGPGAGLQRADAGRGPGGTSRPRSCSGTRGRRGPSGAAGKPTGPGPCALPVQSLGPRRSRACTPVRPSLALFTRVRGRIVPRTSLRGGSRKSLVS